jgi:hypothetical protein
LKALTVTKKLHHTATGFDQSSQSKCISHYSMRAASPDQTVTVPTQMARLRGQRDGPRTRKTKDFRLLATFAAHRIATLEGRGDGPVDDDPQ